MIEETNPLGNIFVSRHAIATIAVQASLQSYGIVGMAAKNLVEGLTQVLIKDPTLGVEVNYLDNSLIINLYIIVEYGTRIKSVANSISDSVRYQVEKALGIPVMQVNIHVRGLRVSDLD